eukprot:Blabericola_migrator_1__14@NODE_1004_length_5726_cov_209_116982_g158_i3_p3_GENE_NODE_1004_length_5726_cov_209_116982_g158_i3NODE_1004_length_5726_cov_209_116982_g158_i3_p3_ORF_typecomplete_len162_score34_73Exo_endo_phos/PF03372_23/4_6e07_NODE_1004_length_5726_cov_209_116982_g158_i310495
MAMKRKSQTKVKEDDDENNVNENVKRVKYNPHVDGRGPSLNGDWREQVAEPTLAPDQIKICTWNVNGLRAVLRSKKLKEESSDFVAYIKEEAPDILCLNETKITPELENLLDETLPDYKSYHAHSDKKCKGHKRQCIHDIFTSLCWCCNPSQERNGFGKRY